MKVVIVNTHDIQGGAARAAYRLHRALLGAGVTSKMLVQTKSSDDYTVHGPVSFFEKLTAKVRPHLDRLYLKWYPNRTGILFSTGLCGSRKIVDQINALKPDVVHLHWINEGFLKIEDLVKIKAPIVWSLHDNWAFTGGCHIKWDCDSYLKLCGSCPHLGSNRLNDLSKSLFEKKARIYKSLPNLTVIGLSKWITESARNSALFSSHRVVNLPNLIDPSDFFPIDKQLARRILNLPQDKKLILFGAMSALSDVNKGFNELSAALKKIRNDDCELVVFGSGKPEVPQDFKQATHYLGRLHDDISLRLVYSAADVMVVPSRQENLSNAIMESLACGTPVVAFDIGGNSDMITHGMNGYLAKPNDVNDLANGIERITSSLLCSDVIRISFDVNGKFSKDRILKLYLDLYKSML